jgi:hypothetical protein
MKMYSLNIRWAPESPANPEVIEEVLSNAGDWLRFGAWSWLVHSAYSAHDISAALQHKVSSDDSILIIACDPTDYGGFAQPWVWEWINKYKPMLAGLGVGMIAPSNRVGGLGGMPKPTNPLSGSSNALAELLTRKNPADPS